MGFTISGVGGQGIAKGNVSHVAGDIGFGPTFEIPANGSHGSRSVLPLRFPQQGWASMSQIAVPVSYGELIDKITILEIKAERIGNPEKLANVRTELDLLTRTWAADAHSAIDIAAERAKLKAVNEALWDIEDHIRVKEKAKAFDSEFVELARAVYFRNDDRAAYKRVINEKLGSTLVEEKSYENYR